MSNIPCSDTKKLIIFQLRHAVNLYDAPLSACSFQFNETVWWEILGSQHPPPQYGIQTSTWALTKVFYATWD